jgi:purine-binding chemotaxis protein CheW
MSMIRDIRPDRQVTVVTLALGNQTLAIPASALREILDPLPVTRVPGAGPFVPGVVNVRGSVVPLASLNVALGIPEAPADTRQRILVIEVEMDGEPATVAIHADAVHEVATIDTAIIEPVPATATAWPQDHLRGLYKGPQGFVLLPDLQAIFSTRPAKAGAA